MATLDINKVAIIGAGAAGICAAKHLHHNKYNDKKFNIVVYEKQDQVGGLWVYNKWDKSKDEKDISPMHKNLISNLPCEGNFYPDFPFPPETPTFPTYKNVLTYLQNYTKHFDVEQFIKFNTEVTLVSPNIERDFIVSEDGSDRFIKWKVESKDLQTGVYHTELFDAVIMCNGLHWKPNIPTVDGIKNFKGRVLHSKFYDEPLDFEGKVVIIHGYGASAVDIIPAISMVATNVYISSRSTLFSGNHPSNVRCVADIHRINGNGEVELLNGFTVDADAIIFCTGYLKDYPFSAECQVDVTEYGKVVSPIYKHLFHAKFPSLVIGSLAYFLPSCAFIHQQFAYVTAVFTGSKSLPNQKYMLNDIEKEKEKFVSPDKPLKEFHTIGFNSFVVADELADLSGSVRNPPVVQDSFIKSMGFYRRNFYNFREEYIRKFLKEETFNPNSVRDIEPNTLNNP